MIMSKYISTYIHSYFKAYWAAMLMKAAVLFVAPMQLFKGDYLQYVHAPEIQSTQVHWLGKVKGNYTKKSYIIKWTAFDNQR